MIGYKPGTLGSILEFNPNSVSTNPNSSRPVPLLNSANIEQCFLDPDYQDPKTFKRLEKAILGMDGPYDRSSTKDDILIEFGYLPTHHKKSCCRKKQF